MHPGKGYRWLEVGEVVAPGDEWFVNETRTFREALPSIGGKVDVPECFRRKLTMLPADPTPVKRVETPHKKLTDGLYFMEHEGERLVVRVQLGSASKAPLFRVADGSFVPVRFVPTAKFYRLPKELQ